MGLLQAGHVKDLPLVFNFFSALDVKTYVVGISLSIEGKRLSNVKSFLT